MSEDIRLPERKAVESMTREELELDLVLANRMIGWLQEKLTAEQMARIKDADKRREREGALTNELRMVQKGVKTGCVCPAGKCMHLTAHGEMCWAEWAGLKAVRDAAQTHLDSLVRNASHPSRMTIEASDAPQT